MPQEPLPVYTTANLPTTALNGGAVMPVTQAPVDVTSAMGKSSRYTTVSVEVDAACTVTIYTYMPASKTWKTPGSSSSSYQKTFASAGWDFFQVKQGTLVFLQFSAAVHAWTDLDPINS